nr:hypothetical protein [Tanacetum cinerariifolium]
EFWATATIHHHAIRFKMDNKKHIVNLESFRDMLHICLRVHGQSFAEPPFEEEILTFICFLGHSAAIRMLTDFNINKLYHPWRFFATIINKCLTGKSSGYDSLRLSQAQILHQNTQQFCALLPIKLTNEEIKNSNAYKEYYAIATRAAPPKPKASIRRTRSSSDITITPPTAAVGPRHTTSQKGKQAAKASKAKSLSALSKSKNVLLLTSLYECLQEPSSSRGVWKTFNWVSKATRRLNLTKPDSYRSDLKRKEAYTAYSNPRGFIYQNKDKKNRLMRIDELHKFSDGTLTDVRNALDDRLKGIQM